MALLIPNFHIAVEARRVTGSQQVSNDWQAAVSKFCMQVNVPATVVHTELAGTLFGGLESDSQQQVKFRKWK